MVGEALSAAEILKNEGIAARVIDMATIKPIDRDCIVRAAKETGAIVTAEEHSIIGGLGGAVAEVVCETVPVPVLRVGVNDTFGKSGPALELLPLFGPFRRALLPRRPVRLSAANRKTQMPIGYPIAHSGAAVSRIRETAACLLPRTD